MLFTLRDAYNFFVELSDKSGPIVGFSKFASLRPEHCVLPGSSGTHSICVCTIHQNMILLLNALNLESLETENVEWSTESILKRMICNSSTDACFTGRSVTCKSFYLSPRFLINISKFREVQEFFTES